MHDASLDADVARPPVAIGGVGGSGTRVGAALLRLLGYDIGPDLNGALDNLWFTLLFKRRAILLESDGDFSRLAQLFFRRLAGHGAGSEAERDGVWRLARQARLQHPPDWLADRARSFLTDAEPVTESTAWGWKEPNTHVVIERLFAVHPRLRYVHFVRHPLDMAASNNNNQLQLWGPVFLNRDVTIDAHDALAYWCAAHRRVTAFMERWPDRTRLVDFDALCDEPARHHDEIAAFLACGPDSGSAVRFGTFIDRSRSSGRFKRFGTRHFDPADLEYVAGLGYDVDA
jgi:hypothetical protein